MYVGFVSEGKFCMCGMLASDMLSLPDVVNSQLREFFRMIEQWIYEAIELGKEQGEVSALIDPGGSSGIYLATLEGGMLIARTYERPEYLETLVAAALAQISN